MNFICRGFQNCVNRALLKATFNLVQLWNGLGIRIQSALHISALDFGDKGEKELCIGTYLALEMQMNSTN